MYNLWLQILAGFIDFSLFPFRPFTALFAGLSSYYFLIYILLPVSFFPFCLTWSFYSFGSHLRLTTNHIPPISTENCCCSITKSCLTLRNSMDCSTPGFPVLHYLPVFTQTHVHWVSDANQLSHPLLPPSPVALRLSHSQGLFQWVTSSHQVAKILELQFQHQPFQWIFGVDFL